MSLHLTVYECVHIRAVPEEGTKSPGAGGSG